MLIGIPIHVAIEGSILSFNARIESRIHNLVFVIDVLIYVVVIYSYTPLYSGDVFLSCLMIDVFLIRICTVVMFFYFAL